MGGREMIIWGKKQEELFKKQLELREKEALIDLHLKLAELQKDCNAQVNQLEHDYHQKKEDYGIALANAKASAESMKLIMEEKDKLITLLRQTVAELSKSRVEVVHTK